MPGSDMGDDNKCGIVGIGDVRITMFNGVTCIVTSVRHVPNL